MSQNFDPETTLQLTRDFAAPPERVFAALLDPQVLQHIWSAPDYKIIEMTLDARVGGGWQMVMREEGSGVRMRCQAQYVEIEPPRRIVWHTQWLDGPMAPNRPMRVTLEFAAHAQGTRLTLTHELFPDRPTRDHHGQGWGQGFDRLEQWLRQTD